MKFHLNDPDFLEMVATEGLKARRARFLPVREAVKERLKGLVEPLRDILQDFPMGRVERRNFRLSHGKTVRLGDVGKRCSGPRIGFLALG